MAFVDDVAVKAAALKARAANLEEGVKQAAMQAMNPPPQNEYDTEALLTRIDTLETSVSNLQTALNAKLDTSTFDSHTHDYVRTSGLTSNANGDITGLSSGTTATTEPN